VEAVPALVSTRGRELGVKSQWWPGLHTAVSVWTLAINSELVYEGDAGTTTAGRPTRRDGVEWSNHWTLARRADLHANLAWTRPRYSDALPEGPYIPNAVQKVAHLGATLRHLGLWSGSVGVRYVGPAPLVENNSVRSASSLTTQVRLSRQLTREMEMSLDILNVANRHNSDISYLYASRVVGEVGGVNDVHVHPAEPRSVRLTTRIHF
jgi:outer membrane cobalamin receptor